MDNISILIAEDENIIVLDLISLLEKSGYSKISVVNDGDSLIKKAFEETPSLIISDILFSGKTDGLTAANKIWERYKIPFIFISGIDFDKNRIDLSQCEVIKKPFKRNDIIRAVKKFLK